MTLQVEGTAPADGMAVRLDALIVEFLTDTPLAEKAEIPVRLMLGESSVVVKIRVQHVTPGEDTLYKRGWFHSGTWRAQGADQARIHAFLAQQRGPGAGFSPRRKKAKGRRGITSSMLRAAERLSEVRSSVVPPDLDDRRAPLPPLPGVPRTRVPLDRRTPVPPHALITPTLSQEGHHGLMAPVRALDELHQALEMGDGWFRLVVERVQALEIGERVHLILALPSGLYLGLEVQVVRVGSHRMLLQASGVPDHQIAMLRTGG